MVLLIIDAQKAITNEKLYLFDTFVANVRELIKTARENGIEVIYVRHDDGPGQELTRGNDGFEIYGAFEPVPGEKIFDKTVNSPFRDTGLLEYLLSKGENQLILAGLQTDYCMDAAVKCGFEHRFQLIVPEHANSTVDNGFMTAEESYEYYNRWLWNERYGKCISLKAALELMILSKSGNM